MPPNVRPPNVEFITTDQQRFDTTGPTAPGFLRTPHLDHLAREGVTFSRAYADCPVYIPSRVSIMTEAARRARPWLGYHTTEYQVDVRH